MIISSFSMHVQCPHLFNFFLFLFYYFYRPVTDYSSIRGRGVCLLDFGRAIDVQSFPRGTQFIGSCGTDSFQCTQMLNQEPWSWHVRSSVNPFISCLLSSLYFLLSFCSLSLSFLDWSSLYCWYCSCPSASRLYGSHQELYNWTVCT